jgi:hypothetical protein
MAPPHSSAALESKRQLFQPYFHLSGGQLCHMFPTNNSLAFHVAAAERAALLMLMEKLSWQKTSPSPPLPPLVAS